MGAAFFGFAMFKLFTGGSLWLVGLCTVASAYIFYRAWTEQTGAAVEDLSLAIDFVRDPYETVIDEAVARLGGDDVQPRDNRQGGVLQQFAREIGLGGEAEPEKPAFDPDAAIARYLANRPAEAQPARGFGCKRA